jgi:CubicO group peptidase (beta-lactamase class C family)
MYHTAAEVPGVLIARATGMSFWDALRERICGPPGMKDTAFSVGGQSISRLATAYQRDEATGEVVVEDGPDGYRNWSSPPTATRSQTSGGAQRFGILAQRLRAGQPIGLLCDRDLTGTGIEVELSARRPG